MSWVFLALMCALSLALADTASKRWLTHAPAPTLTLIRSGLPGVVLLPALYWIDVSQMPWAFWGWVMAAMPLEILAMALYTRAIRESALSQTLPYMAFTPVFTVLTGWVLLGETVSMRGMAGILLVTAGAWGLNLEHAGWHPRTWLLPFRAMLVQRGARLMLVVAAIYSVTAALGKGAVGYMDGAGEHMGGAAFGALYFIVLGACAFLYYGLRAPLAVKGALGAGRYAWLVAGLLAFMVITHFMALAQAGTAYMIAVKRTSVLFGILLGAWVFREDRLTQHLGAALLMVAGVAMIVG
jgi:drug/metabolite transporter (DMT)-like permease